MAPDAVITERVYASVKRQILSGHFPPGDRLEVKGIAYDQGTSITPVRDAIHRLIGERLLEFQGHGGFQVPILSEAALRALYAWHLQLLKLALAVPHPREVESDIDDAAELFTAEHIVDRIERLFASLIQRSANRDFHAAASIAAERLRPVRFAELRSMSYPPSEIEELQRVIHASELSDISVKITAYHTARLDRVADTVEAMQSR